MNKFLFSLIVNCSLMSFSAFAMEGIKTEEKYPHATIRSLYVSEEAKEDGLKVYLNPCGAEVATNYWIQESSYLRQNTKDDNFSENPGVRPEKVIRFGTKAGLCPFGENIFQQVPLHYFNLLLVKAMTSKGPIKRVFPDITADLYIINVIDKEGISPDITLTKIETEGSTLDKRLMRCIFSSPRKGDKPPKICLFGGAGEKKGRKEDHYLTFELNGPENRMGYIFMGGIPRDKLSPNIVSYFPALKPGYTYDIHVNYLRGNRYVQADVVEVSQDDSI